MLNWKGFGRKWSWPSRDTIQDLLGGHEAKTEIPVGIAGVFDAIRTEYRPVQV
jgi:hypothetical protein